MARKPKTSTNKAFCDRLARRLVMHREAGLDGTPVCQFCGLVTATDWAHIIPRRYSAVRCAEDNAWALCRACHRVVDQWIEEKLKLIERTIGMERYEELRRLAEAGPPMSYELWWREERERLTARCVELGVSTKWKESA